MFDWLFGGSFDPNKDIPSLKDKVILVTGGNNGLGKETVLQLSKHSAHIYLAARTESKARAAITEIKLVVPNADITFLQLDLSSFASVKQAAKNFLAQSDRLDVLVDNAGIAGMPYSLTEDGYEIVFATNHIGHALLTKLLLPTLLKTAELPGADVRVVNVSSKGERFAPAEGIVYDQQALEKVAKLSRYGHSKLANILHARELQRRYPSITATAVHPGVSIPLPQAQPYQMLIIPQVIMTDIYASFSETNSALRFLAPAVQAIAPYGVLPDVYDVPGGTLTQLWAATAPKEEVRKSHYFLPVGVASAGSKHAQDAEMGKQLWEWTDKAVADVEV
ncbi:hypothetical protein LTR15_007891 [Elasticomyces elasticus]|nr:hypothetical protein LTR15_007891 [Elasticomyces elasticus]